MIVSFKSRPTWERSYKIVSAVHVQGLVGQVNTNLDVVALVVVATFPKQAMMHDIVNVQLVEQRVSVLVNGVRTKPQHHPEKNVLWRRKR